MRVKNTKQHFKMKSGTQASPELIIMRTRDGHQSITCLLPSVGKPWGTSHELNAVCIPRHSPKSVYISVHIWILPSWHRHFWNLANLIKKRLPPSPRFFPCAFCILVVLHFCYVLCSLIFPIFHFSQFPTPTPWFCFHLFSLDFVCVALFPFSKLSVGEGGPLHSSKQST